jgi:hypothetical protein
VTAYEKKIKSIEIVEGGLRPFLQQLIETLGGNKMSTRSLIFILENNTYHGIYCHSDGYPSGNGSILLHNYQDIKKIKQLINLGDISHLGTTINPSPREKMYGDPNRIRTNRRYLELSELERNKLDQQHFSDEFTSAYHRDWHEEWLTANLTLEEFQSESFVMIAYIYVFDINKNQWFCYDRAEKGQRKHKLTDSWIENHNE